MLVTHAWGSLPDWPPPFVAIAVGDVLEVGRQWGAFLWVHILSGSSQVYVCSGWVARFACTYMNCSFEDALAASRGEYRTLWLDIRDGAPYCRACEEIATEAHLQSESHIVSLHRLALDSVSSPPLQPPGASVASPIIRTPFVDLDQVTWLRASVSSGAGRESVPAAPVESPGICAPPVDSEPIM